MTRPSSTSTRRCSRRSAFRRATCRAAICSLLVSAALAPLPSGAPTRRLDAEIVALERDLAGLADERDSFLRGLARLQATERLLAARAERLTFEREERRREERLLAERVAELERERENAEERLEAALVALHRMGPPRPLARLAQGESPARAMRASRYVAHLADEETEGLARLAELRRELERGQAALREAQARTEEAERGLQSERRALALARRETEAHLLSLGGDEALRRRALQELGRARATLARFFAPEGHVVMGLVSMEAFRGLLPHPVEAPVAAPFGTRRHPRFKTRVPHPGLTYAAPKGTPVRAVFDGKVVFSGWFEGYGQTLIMEHGEGYFTVYAHNDALEKSAGDAAAKGDVVARSGDTGSLAGAALYFELRRGSEPLDPAPWLRSR